MSDLPFGGARQRLRRAGEIAGAIVDQGHCGHGALSESRASNNGSYWWRQTQARLPLMRERMEGGGGFSGRRRPLGSRAKAETGRAEINAGRANPAWDPALRSAGSPPPDVLPGGRWVDHEKVALAHGRQGAAAGGRGEAGGRHPAAGGLLHHTGPPTRVGAIDQQDFGRAVASRSRNQASQAKAGLVRQGGTAPCICDQSRRRRVSGSRAPGVRTVILAPIWLGGGRARQAWSTG